MVGVPMYADIFGTIPVAEAMLSKSAQLGTVLSFMMAVSHIVITVFNHVEKGCKAQIAGIIY